MCILHFCTCSTYFRLDFCSENFRNPKIIYLKYLEHAFYI
ncbi:unnamed protein product, partial [Arabidopsis halleri]